jgi:hypothetical protein
MHLSDSHDKPEQPHANPQALTFWQMVGSVLASFFGVQSAKNRERDFAHGKARTFILIGILMTIAWYGTISLVVHFVLKK